MRKLFKIQPKDDLGFSMVMVLTFIIVMGILATALVSIMQDNLFIANNNSSRQQAFNISEAGINYYLWHLSHNPTDYKDGKTTPATQDPVLGYGPYVHDYIDDNSKTTGTYTLWIKPQGAGSTIATVRSIGRVTGTNAIRTIDAQLGVPSFANYAVDSDSSLWFGNTETADGPVHSNQGVRMDGASTTDVTAANATYTPSSQKGGNGSSKAGVWCDTAATTPVNCNTRNKTDWRYPVANIDYNLITSSLCNMKKIAFTSNATTSALASGATACSQTPTTRTPAYVPQRATTYTASKGYMIQLNTDGTYDLLNVNAENDLLTPYTSALTTTSVATGIAIDPSGIIFVEDNVWVRTNPTFTGRVTVAAGRLATTNNANAVIADDIIYSTKDGSDAIGIVTEGDITLAPYAPPATGNFNFEVDAALLAQTGNVLYPATYKSDTARCTRGWVNPGQTFKFYGSISTRLDWTWTWLLGNSSCGDAALGPGNKYITGVLNNTTEYDYSLQYAPPPSFPLTSTYNIMSWREVLTVP
jgi:type II secretory pathway pseudopilin PulG